MRRSQGTPLRRGIRELRTRGMTLPNEERHPASRPSRNSQEREPLVAIRLRRRRSRSGFSSVVQA